MDSETPRQPYAPSESYRRRSEDHAYPTQWPAAQHAPRPLEHPQQPSPNRLRVMTISVYAHPYAYTCNNEPLYVQFGTPGAAETARASQFITSQYSPTYSHMHPEQREEQFRSTPVNSRAFRPYSQSTHPHPRYETYEYGYLPRVQNNYEYTYGDQHNAHVENHPDYDRQNGRPNDPIDVKDNRTNVADPQFDNSRYPRLSDPRRLPPPSSAVVVGYDGSEHAEEEHRQTKENGDIEEIEPSHEDHGPFSAHDREGKNRRARVYRSYNPVSDIDGKEVKPREMPITRHSVSTPSHRNEDDDYMHDDLYRKPKRGSDFRDSESDGRGKRVRLNWAGELHASFMRAVEEIGIEKAVPTSIMKAMGVDGLTRENVASHLQKYRGMLKKEKEDAERQLLMKAAAKSVLQNDGGKRKSSLTDEEVLKAVAEREKVLTPSSQRRQIRKAPQNHDMSDDRSVSAGKTSTDSQETSELRR